MLKVEGLKEFTSALRKVSADLPRVVRRVNADIARQVAADAKSEAMGLPGRSKFAGLISSSAGQNFAAVRVSASHPAAGGWVFGSRRFRQFRSWIGNRADLTSDTYAVGPAIQKNLPRIEASYHARIGVALRKAFPKGSG